MKLFVKMVSLILLVFISVVPLKSFSQRSSQLWTTPIQNVEFTDSVIVVTNSGHALRILNNLKPVHYDISLVKINVEEIRSHEWNGYRDYEKQLADFIEGWEFTPDNNHDKEKFLESSVLLILLNAPVNKSVPEDLPFFLEILGQDKVKDIAHHASLVKTLYDSYFN